MQATAHTTTDAKAAAKYVRRVKGPLFMDVIISGLYTDPMLTMVVKSELAYNIEQMQDSDLEYVFNVCKNGYNYLYIREQ